MKLKRNKLLLLILMIVASLIIASKPVFGTGPSSLDLNYGAEPYTMMSNLYCMNHSKLLAVRDVNNKAEDKMLYTLLGSASTVEPSTGYAVALANGSDDAAVQNVVWSSRQWGNDSNVLEEGSNPVTTSNSTNVIEQRSYQYGTVYYEIFSKITDSNNLFSTTTRSSDLKVLVDQVDKTYTVGPYTLSLNISDASVLSKQILYNELIGTGNQGYTSDNAFAKYTGMTGIDGRNIQFVNGNGSVITFPDFASGDAFYIRFTPNDINSVPSTIEPKFNISYIAGYNGDVTTYKISQLTYLDVTFSRSNTEVTSYIRTSMDENGYCIGKGSATGHFKIHTRGGAEVDVTVPLNNIDVESNDGITWYMLGSRTQTVSVNIQTCPGFNSIADKIQDVVYIPPTINVSAQTYEQLVKPVWKDASFTLPGKTINEVLGGNVWQDLPENKTGNRTGIKDEGESVYAGMQVELFEVNGTNAIQTTVTDTNGQYRFEHLNPMKKYYVRFTYNGEIYQSTYYKNQLTGGYSNAVDQERDSFNNRFGTIDSTGRSYKLNDRWNEAYALKSKLEKDNGEFISYKTDSNDGALTYQDAWNEFVTLAANKKSYSQAYIELDKWLLEKGTGNKDKTNVIQFIKDCMITSTTYVSDPLTNNAVEYPVYNQFVLEDLNNPPDTIKTETVGKQYSYLYTKLSDQSRYVDYGIELRETADLAIQKDVYKSKVIINGKQEEYKYDKKGDNNADTWEIDVRAADELYNGSYSYTREVRKSEYLYTASKLGTTSQKDLQVYVTYKIVIKNQGTVDASVNEIVDYYDADQYSFDGTLNGKYYTPNSYNNYDSNGNITNTYINSYVGDAEGNKTSDIKVSSVTSETDRDYSSKTLTNGNYNYSSLYLTEITKADGNDKLGPGEFAYVYVTFKVNKDENGKVKLDENLETGAQTVGKRNLVEINGYSTYYGSNTKIPNYLQADNTRKDIDVGGKTAGIIDVDSKAGNLAVIDLTADGNIDEKENDPVKSRREDDTDKAPNIRLVINRTDRIISGYTYEDTRNTTSDKAVVGNGIYDNGDTLINGVTVELVELVQNVDEHGIATGSYSGEYVWSTKQMSYDADNKKWVLSDNSDRYYSGSKKAKTILTGTGILNVDDSTTINDGEYSFLSVPTGDFFVRFTYGDTNQTVLVKSNDVTSLISESGLNAKSYNGQDYKSTTYQSGISQSGSYNGINGYTDTENQNYTKYDDKASMYRYNVVESGKVQGASDAKDVYSYRDNANKYSQGELLNNKSEILDSWEKIATYNYLDTDTLTADQKTALSNNLSSNETDLKKALVNAGLSSDKADIIIASIKEAIAQQKAMIKELEDKTQMVAQTGIIDTTVEKADKNGKVQDKNNVYTYTDLQGNENVYEYNISNVDLGLEERPEAQLKLSKEVSNFKIVLANNETLFDTNQSVNNLYFAKHVGHSTGYTGYRMNIPSINKKNTTDTPELIQGYMDDELMQGSTLQATYKIAVTNVGEVDYLDKQFYYIGKTSNPDSSNISKTNANEVVDYVSNMIKYDSSEQGSDAKWDISNASTLTNSASKDKSGNIVIDQTKVANDIVNREYYNNLITYNSVLTTGKLSNDLLPECFDKNNDSITTSLVVSTLLSANNNANNLVYNNLSEIVKTSNTQGRRMQYSIVGNQPMSDQSLGENAKTTSEGIYTSIDLVTPTEIDADSAQKVLLLPPTGDNRQYIPVVIALIASLGLIIGTIVIIRKKIIRFNS